MRGGGVRAGGEGETTTKLGGAEPTEVSVGRHQVASEMAVGWQRHLSQILSPPPSVGCAVVSEERPRCRLRVERWSAVTYEDRLGDFPVRAVVTYF